MFKYVSACVIALAVLFASVVQAVAAQSRTPLDLAVAVERRAGATDFSELEAFGEAALRRDDREGLNRIYHVTWIILNQGDFERAAEWNRRLTERARVLNDGRYRAIAHLNNLTIRYDQGDNAAVPEVQRVADRTDDWFVKAHATRLIAIALMDEDRIGEGLNLLTEMDAEIPEDDPYAMTAHAGLWEMAGIGLMKLNDFVGATQAFGRFEIDYSHPDYPRPDFDSLYNLTRLAVQVGDFEMAQRLYESHHRLTVRANLESLSVYDANLCAMVAEGLQNWRGVLDCVEPYGVNLAAASFLAPQLLPKRAIAHARLGRVSEAERDLALIRSLQARGDFREEGFTVIPLVEAELLFAQGRPSEGFQRLRDYHREAGVQAAQRFSAGISQVTGDMQAQLAERRHQLETERSNAALQQEVIGSQRWIVAVAALFLVSAACVLAWQLRTGRHLKEARRRAESANLAKSEFLANMSHEIRTPLNGVVAMADALSRSDLPQREREMVEVVRASGVTLERLLSDILDSAKIEAGQVAIEVAPFQLGDAVREVAALYRTAAETKDVALVADIDPSLDRRVLGDGVRIRQVLANLVSNALKFTGDGSVTIRVEPVGDRVRFSVADTGVGFDAEQKARIFGRFQQADGSITRRFGGTGLGLAISRDLAALMGGELDCDSTPGEGARFWFDVELPATDEAEPAPAIQADCADCDQGRPMRILVADDHPANRKVIEVMLSGMAAELVTVTNGQEALDAFVEGGFDLVLMDMQMPVMDGLAATRAIREHEQAESLGRTPVLMLTANALAEHVEAGRRAGADGHLAKPITLSSLLTAITAAVEPKAKLAA